MLEYPAPQWAKNIRQTIQALALITEILSGEEETCWFNWERKLHSEKKICSLLILVGGGMQKSSPLFNFSQSNTGEITNAFIPISIIIRTL